MRRACMSKVCLTLTILSLFGASACRAAAPSVTNVRAEQRRGTGYVDITYDLADADTATLDVSAEVSTNGGAVFFTPASLLIGDVGSVARGTGRKIVWNAGTALPPKLYSNVRARITASDKQPPPGMVRIPGGTNAGFAQDFGGYSLTVTAFYMDATEVTKAKWDEVHAWAVSNGYSFNNTGSGKASNHPVHSITRWDIIFWCNARSQKEGKTPCYVDDRGIVCITSQANLHCNFDANGYRLPTNTEWEYAARGGASSRRFPWGDTIDHTWANYYSKWIEGKPYISFDTGYEGYDTRYATGGYPYTSPVGSFPPNGYGLYDMAGNAWERCYSQSDSPLDVHGGSCARNAYRVQCGSTFNIDPPYDPIGFRAVCR